VIQQAAAQAAVSPGVKLVGPLRPALQKWTIYAAVVMPEARPADAARVLVAFFKSPETAALIAPKGFAAP
jgi:hypothetical protein